MVTAAEIVPIKIYGFSSLSAAVRFLIAKEVCWFRITTNSLRIVYWEFTLARRHLASNYHWQSIAMFSVLRSRLITDWTQLLFDRLFNQTPLKAKSKTVIRGKPLHFYCQKDCHSLCNYSQLGKERHFLDSKSVLALKNKEDHSLLLS